MGRCDAEVEARRALRVGQLDVELRRPPLDDGARRSGEHAEPRQPVGGELATDRELREVGELLVGDVVQPDQTCGRDVDVGEQPEGRLDEQRDPTKVPQPNGVALLLASLRRFGDIASRADAYLFQSGTAAEKQQNVRKGRGALDVVQHQMCQAGEVVQGNDPGGVYDQLAQILRLI